MTVTENVEPSCEAAGLPPGRDRRADRARHPHGRPGRLRGRLSARAVRRHEAARRHGPGPVGRPRDPLHGRAVQPGRRPHGGEPAGRGHRHLGGQGPQPVVDPDGQPRHQGSGLHGRPHRGPRRQPGPGADHCREPPAAAARLPLARVPAAWSISCTTSSPASELPDVPRGAGAGGPTSSSPCPRRCPSEIVGLLEYLDARGGKEDVFRIAADTQPRVRPASSTSSKAAEMLDFVDTPKRMVVLEPDWAAVREGGSQRPARPVAGPNP